MGLLLAHWVPWFSCTLLCIPITLLSTETLKPWAKRKPSSLMVFVLDTLSIWQKLTNTATLPWVYFWKEKWASLLTCSPHGVSSAFTDFLPSAGLQTWAPVVYPAIPRSPLCQSAEDVHCTSQQPPKSQAVRTGAPVWWPSQPNPSAGQPHHWSLPWQEGSKDPVPVGEMGLR